jgi:RNA polymerase sigma-70 factor (ECF subfamily)
MTDQQDSRYQADTPVERVVRLAAGHHDTLYRYIFSMVPNEPDARDILQETCVAIHRRAELYDPEQPFLAWAFRFAYFEVLNHRKRQARAPLCFDPDVLELLAREREAAEEYLNVRLQALDHCLAALDEKDRRLIRARYYDEIVMEEAASQLGMSRRTLFRNLDRVRLVLMDCIHRRLDVEPDDGV